MTASLEVLLRQLGMSRYARTFAKRGIDVAALGALTEDDLSLLGVLPDDRAALLAAVKALAALDPKQAGLASQALASVANHGERRQLTVMFCDLVGSTELSVRFDPEDLQKIFDEYQKRCAAIVERFHGNVARYMGDGMLVHFGYPQADEHSSESAVRAGLEIASAVRELKIFPGLELHTRVGISTGEVVVGHLVAEGIVREHSVLGTTPNLAARLQELAQPDTVVISASTRRLVGRLFEYEDLGEHALKGFGSPVRAWRVEGESGLDSRFEAAHPVRELTPLVGRVEEMAVLTSLWRKAQRGGGQAVILGGEAGIGKSRLVLTLCEATAADSPTLLQYFGAPYYQHSTLYPVIKQLERAARFSDDDSVEEKLAKLELAIEQATQSVVECAPLLAGLLSIEAGGRYPPLTLSPELQHERTLEVLEGLLFGLARRRPVIIIVEDLQWIDPATLELAGRLVSRIHSIPALLVLTHRPEFVPSISARSHVTRLVLDRLNREDSIALARGVTKGKSLPGEILEHVLDKSDGVPLFVEELVKNVVESGVLREDADHYSYAKQLPNLGLPNTLQDSLMARLDRQGLAKRIAQRGAVIGRRFPHELIAAICDLDGAQLRRSLDDLASAELIFPRAGTPTVYEFKHALVQDAAYSTLLRADRRALHARVARALEQTSPATVDTEPELLAHHFTEAGLEREAIPYLLRAGQRAGTRAAHQQAVRYLEQALALIARLPDGAERDALELNAQPMFGLSLAAGRSYALPEVEHAYRRARVLCSRLGDEAAARFPVIRSGLVTYYLVRAQHRISDQLAQEFVRAAENAIESGSPGNPELIAYHIDACRCLGYTRFFLGELEASHASLERAITLFEAHKDQALEFGTPENPVLATLAVMPLVLWLLGRPAEALRRHQEGLAFAQQSNHPFNLAFVHSWATVFHQWRGMPEESEEHARRGIEITSQYRFDHWLRIDKIHLGIAMAARGRPAEGKALMLETLPSRMEAGMEAFTSYFLYGLATSHQAGNEPAAAIEVLEDALMQAKDHDELFYMAELYRLRGLLKLARSPGAVDDVDADFLKALEIARRQGARALELRAAMSRHEFLSAKGRGTESRPALQAVFSTFTQGFELPDLTKARELLSQAP